MVDLHIRENKIDISPLPIEIQTTIADKLKDRPDGYNYAGAFKAKVWDGYISMYDKYNKTISYNFVNEVNEVLDDVGISVNYINHDGYSKSDYLPLPEFNMPFELHSWQQDFCDNILSKENRATVLSATSSGKSAMLTMIAKMVLNNSTKKVLFTTISVDLVNQLYDDLIEFGVPKDKINKVQKNKNFDAPIVIMTWQMCYSMINPKLKSKTEQLENTELLKSFDCFVADECHCYKSDALYRLGDVFSGCDITYGFTGTLDGSNFHKLVMRKCFGDIFTLVKTKEMMDSGKASNLTIKPIKLNWDKLVKNKFFKTYKDEVDLIEDSLRRNTIVSKIIAKIETDSNIVVFVNSHKHREQFSTELRKYHPSVIEYHGKMKVAERRKAKNTLETTGGNVCICTYGTFQTGISINNISHGVFLLGYKKPIRVLQSIGRLLRLNIGSDNNVTLIDIADLLTGKNLYHNTLYNHFLERVDIYMNEQFKVNPMITLDVGDIRNK